MVPMSFPLLQLYSGKIRKNLMESNSSKPWIRDTNKVSKPSVEYNVWFTVPINVSGKKFSGRCENGGDDVQDFLSV